MEILYKRSLDRTLLRCLDQTKIKNALQEVHKGICVTHANGHIMTRQKRRFGYFWMTMERDCIEYIRKYHKCYHLL